MEFSHRPVLYEETLKALDIRPDGVYIDGTAGGGGHSEGIASRLTTGTLLSIDQDPDAIEALHKRLDAYPRVIIHRGNFSQMDEAAAALSLGKADGVLLDIGVSSHQLDTPERGFSYHHDAPLDMRMSRTGPSAADLVNTLSRQELAGIISRYGEEKSAGRIAQAIAAAREQKPLKQPPNSPNWSGRRCRRRAARGRASGEKDLSGAAHRRQRRAGPALRRAGRRLFPLKAGGKARGDHLSFARGPHGQAENGQMVYRLYLPARFSRVRVRQNARRQAAFQKAGGGVRRRTGGESAQQERKLRVCVRLK